MKPEKKSNKKFIIYSIIVLGIIAMFAIGANMMIGNDSVDTVTVDSEIIVEAPDAPLMGTAVQWDGRIDVFVTRADTGIKEQVVFGEHNLLTTLGADQIRGHLNGTVAAAAISHMSLSNDASAASDTWTQLPSEIAVSGLGRATSGTGVVNNGTAAFNVTHEWTASASQSCQLVGLHWVATPSSDDNLMSAVKFAQQNLLINDQLEIVYSVTLS